MRILHTSDWHLGRIFHGIHLTDDQAHVLDQIVEIVADARPDAVLIAGDVYDRAVPPREAVALLDDVLRRLVLGHRTPVVLIAGNHDSPERLAFGSRILAAEGLHIAGPLEADVRPVVLVDADGPVHAYPLPYAEPAVARARLGDDTLRDHDVALAASVARIRAAHPRSARSVLMAHAFVAGGAVSDSERPLSVGGAGTVEAGRLSGFDYVALGHLHRAQAVGGESGGDDGGAVAGEGRGEGGRAGRGVIRYAGSPLKYSFSEIGPENSVTMVEIDARGGCRVEAIPLSPRHEVRRIEGTLAEILARPGREPGDPGAGPGRNDYLTVRLLDREALFDPLARLRERYPNVLEIERPALEAAAGREGAAGADHRTMSDIDLFASFYRQVTGDEITDPQRDAFTRIVDGLRRAEREAGAEETTEREAAP